MSKQRPILFNGEMVLAIDGDMKTETRRTRGLKDLNEDPDNWMFMWQEPDKKWLFVSVKEHWTKSIKCPYGEAGDYLYVRETFERCKMGYRYKAGNISSIAITGKWTPSIHMPKEAARIWLQIVEVRIERLKSITQLGAKNEGVVQARSGLYKNYLNKGFGPTSPLGSFITLWDHVNGSGAFHSNPWVWVVKFKKIQKT